MHPRIMEAVTQFVQAVPIEHADNQQRLESLADRIADWTLEHVLAPEAVKSPHPVTAFTVIDRSESMKGLPLVVARCFMRLNTGFLVLCHPDVDVIPVAQDIDAEVVLHDEELYTTRPCGTCYKPAYDLVNRLAGFHSHLFHASDGGAFESPDELAQMWRRALSRFERVSYLEVERCAFGPHHALEAHRSLSSAEKERFSLSRIRVAY